MSIPTPASILPGLTAISGTNGEYEITIDLGAQPDTIETDGRVVAQAMLDALAAAYVALTTKTAFYTVNKATTAQNVQGVGASIRKTYSFVTTEEAITDGFPAEA